MGKRSRFHTWLRKASDKALANEYERRRRLDDGREMKRISCEMGRRLNYGTKRADGYAVKIHAEAERK